MPESDSDFEEPIDFDPFTFDSSDEDRDESDTEEDDDEPDQRDSFINLFEMELPIITTGFIVFGYICKLQKDFSMKLHNLIGPYFFHLLFFL